MNPAVAHPRVTRAELAAPGVLVVHFWAPWNLHNQVLAENLVKAHQLSPSGAKVRSLDIDNQDFWTDLRGWGVVNIPALGLFRDGRHVQNLIGVMGVEKLRHHFENTFVP